MVRVGVELKLGLGLGWSWCENGLQYTHEYVGYGTVYGN